jgi:type-F conjugative transfer system pilin assembly thiol-disulfide isomerase TrbB
MRKIALTALTRRSTRTMLVLIPLFLLCARSRASTWDEIATLDAAKASRPEISEVPATDTVPPRWLTLSDGQRVNTSEWKLVLFMQSSCAYCRQFNPLLQALAEQTGISVLPWTLDGAGDATFPAALPASAEVKQAFFAHFPLTTPTTFLVNVHSMATWPLLQGAADKRVLARRLDEVLRQAKARGRGE